MPVMDEFREEREALKHGTPKQKLQYFWDYYRWPTIIGVCLLCAAISFIYHLVTAKDTAFYGVFLNCYASEETAAPLKEEFTEFAGIDSRKEEIIIDTSMMLSEDALDESSYNTIQKMMVLIAASELDAIAGNDFAFERYVYTGSMADLREVLTPEQIAAYEPYFYYMDMAIYQKLESARDDMGDLSSIAYPDPRDPESMEDPVPVGVFLEYTDKLTDRYAFMGESAVLGVVANSPRKETAALFIDYLFQ